MFVMLLLLERRATLVTVNMLLAFPLHLETCVLSTKELAAELLPKGSLSHSSTSFDSMDVPSVVAFLSILATTLRTDNLLLTMSHKWLSTS